MVKDVMKRTKGAAGPSGMDAGGCRRMLISGNFGNVGEERKSIAEMAKRLSKKKCKLSCCFPSMQINPT